MKFRSVLYASISSLLLVLPGVAYAQPKDRALPESPSESRNAPAAEQGKSTAMAKRPAKSHKRRAKSSHRTSKETK